MVGPVAVVAQLLLEAGAARLDDALEFILRDALGHDLAGDAAGEEGHLLGQRRGRFNLDEEVAEALPDLAAPDVVERTVGGAEFLADLHAEAVVEDLGQHLQAAGGAEIVVIDARPVDAHRGLAGFAALEQPDLLDGLGGQRGFPRRVGQRIDVARRQRAEGAADRAEGVVEVELAGDAELHRALGEHGLEPLGHFRGRALLDLVGRHEAVALIATGHHGRAHGAEKLHRLAIDGGIEGLDAGEGALVALEPEGRVGDEGGDDLQQLLQFVGRAEAREVATLLLDAEIKTQRIARQPAAQLDVVVASQSAREIGSLGQQGEAGFVRRLRG